MDMQNTSPIQRYYVCCVRGNDVVRDVFFLRHDTQLAVGFGRVVDLVFVGMRKDRRDAVPATATRHATCRRRAP